MNRNFTTLQDFMNNVHKLGYSLVDNGGIKVPCLYVEESEYQKIMNLSYGKSNLIDTNLNIYDDGKHVFVDINIKFIDSDLEFDFLLFANETLLFFESLSNAGVLALAPHESHTGNIFFIQLPKKERVENAFKMIKSKIK